MMLLFSNNHAFRISYLKQQQILLIQETNFHSSFYDVLAFERYSFKCSEKVKRDGADL
jgi:hypothetical protein